MSMRRCEIVQDLCFLTEEQIIKAITGRRSINKYAYILHDKDTYTAEDEKKVPTHKAGTLKSPHWHIVLQFYDGQQQQIKYIAKWFGQEERWVQKIKSRNIEDAFTYLIHQNAPKKFQYDPSEVKANFDYVTFIEQNSMFVERLDVIIEQIGNGTITRSNYNQHISIHEYVQYSTEIKKAFDYYDKTITTTDRELEAIFITGGSGTGKTTLAKYIANEKGASCFISSVGQDMLDGYDGEEVIVYNDIRGNCGLAFNEFIQLVDNNTNARGKSRFRNKNLSKCKLVIVTTVLSMEQLLYQLDPRQQEDWKQFRRRFKLLLTVHPEHIQVEQYSFNKDTYINPTKFHNPIKDLIVGAINSPGLSAEEISNFLHIPLLPEPLESEPKQEREENSNPFITGVRQSESVQIHSDLIENMSNSVDDIVVPF